MTTLKLSQALKRFNKESEEELLRKIRFIVFDILRRVVAYMPVDTGRARGGTQVTINEPTRVDPELKDKAGEDTLYASATAAKDVKLGDVAYIANAVHYVPYLEEGTATQAPVKMFDRALREVTQSLR